MAAYSTLVIWTTSPAARKNHTQHNGAADLIPSRFFRVLRFWFRQQTRSLIHFRSSEGSFVWISTCLVHSSRVVYVPRPCFHRFPSSTPGPSPGPIPIPRFVPIPSPSPGPFEGISEVRLWIAIDGGFEIFPQRGIQIDTRNRKRGRMNRWGDWYRGMNRSDGNGSLAGLRWHWIAVTSAATTMRTLVALGPEPPPVTLLRNRRYPVDHA